jgi:HK97 family phage portal protein
MNGILKSMFEQRALDENSGWGLINRLRDGVSTQTIAGVAVSELTSLRSSAVFGCVRILAETVASLPLPVYERLPNGGKRAAPGHPLYPVLHDLPNPEMTSFNLRETLIGHAALWGNAYCEIVSDGAGNVRELWPFRPDRMQVLRNSKGELVYVYSSQKNGNRAYPAENIFHLRGLGLNGLMGLSMIKLAAQSIGLSLATEQYGAAFFGNGAIPGGVLQHPAKLDDPAYDRLKESWEDRHQGSDRAKRVAILEEGMTYQSIGIPPEDAQFLETRKFQVTEIARIYRVPPHMLADLERASFANIEHQGIEFVTHTIRPWLVNFEQESYRSLFTKPERKRYLAEFNVDGLLRGDIASRYQAYAVGRQNGWLSANDVRRRENLNPIDDGDVYLVPLNMIPANQVGDGLRSMHMQPDGSFKVLPGEVHEISAIAPQEERSAQSAAVRRRLMLSYRSLFQETAGRVIRRESNDIRRAARKIFKTRTYADFASFLDDFFAEHEEFVITQMNQVTQSYAELIAAEAAGEVEFKDLDTVQIQRFISRYVAAYASRHVAKSRDAIDAALAKAKEEGVDPVDAVEAELDHWENQRPATIAQTESVRANGAISEFVYAAAGIIFLVWRAYGDSCPYCKSLNGRKVGIKEWFLAEGENFKPDGAETPLKPKRNVKHPPAHGGCDCLITAGF